MAAAEKRDFAEFAFAVHAGGAFAIQGSASGPAGSFLSAEKFAAACGPGGSGNCRSRLRANSDSANGEPAEEPRPDFIAGRQDRAGDARENTVTVSAHRSESAANGGMESDRSKQW